MHETGIAWDILEAAAQRAAQAGEPLTRVGVRLGEMSGVVAASLEFAFDALKAQAGVPQAELVIESVPVEALCPRCGSRRTPEGELVLWCPDCGSPMTLCSGEQMDLAWIEVEESSGAAAG
jgi:hydrogenase nickel incorporation protein HypA/HybF